MNIVKSSVQKNVIRSNLEADLRQDFRKYHEFRDLNAIFLPSYGSVDISLGKTRVIASVSSNAVPPFSDRPGEGILQLNASFSPSIQSSMTQVEISTLNELEISIVNMLDRVLKASRAVDTEGLCIVAGKLVWQIDVNVTVLSNDGNIIDCCCLAAIIALLDFRRPDVTVVGGDQEVIIHSPEDRHPLPLSIHHIPICATFSFYSDGKFVIDPTSDEEAIQQSSLTICMNSQRELCALSKYGGVAIEIDTISHCCEFAFQRTEEISKQIREMIVTKRKLLRK